MIRALLQAYGFQWSLLRYNMCPDFFPGYCSVGHHCSHNASISTCVFTTRPSRTWSTSVGIFQTIAESSDTSPILCAQHVQQSVHMSIQLLAGLQCEPVQIAEIVKQKYVLVRGALLYSTVNVASTVYLPKHHS